MSTKEVFTQIYESNHWIKGSGEGSYPEHTTPYRNYLQKFLKDKNIQTVVDLGCGDWQFSKLIDWGLINYTGFDVVESVIETNKKQYSKENINFQLMNENNIHSLPKADLLIVKDVMQHWPQKNIEEFIPLLKNYKFALLTNCITPQKKINRDIKMGEFRPLDLKKAPFNLKSLETVLEFAPEKKWTEIFKKTWKKKTDLLTNQIDQKDNRVH